MRKDFFTYGTVNSADYGVGIWGDQLFEPPARAVNRYEVPGRNGDLTIDGGRFENVEVKYKAYIVKDFVDNMNTFRNAMMALRGYQRLEDTVNPDEFRMAQALPFEIDMAGVLKGAEFELSFNCKPQRFLKDGEAVIPLTRAGAVYNRTLFDAKPLLRIYGSGAGRVGVGSQTIALTAINQFVDIDCELMDAVKNGVSQNANVSFTGDIVLAPGTNNINFSGGVTRVNVTPRWFII